MSQAKERLLSGSILDEQIKLETEAVNEGIIKYRRLVSEAVRRGDGSGLKPAERMLMHWMEPVCREIARLKRKLRGGGYDTDAAIYGPVFLATNTRKLALMTIATAMSACMDTPSGVRFSSLSYEIGSEIVADIHANMLRKDHAATWKKLNRRFRRLDSSKVNRWAKKTIEDNLWSLQVCTKLGARLLWILIENASAAGYDEPFKIAFHHSNRKQGRRQVAIVRMDDRVFKIIEEGHAIRQLMRPRYLPMVVKPYAWSEHAQGGYVRIRTPFVAKPRPLHKKALAAADLSLVYKCLDALGSTPFTDNTPIVETVKTYWRHGGNVVGLPAARDREFPPPPPGMDRTKEGAEAWENVDPAERKAWRLEAAAVWKFNDSQRAGRRSMEQTIGIAERFRGRQFYYPHQLDFRSRCYPIPIHFHHHDDDARRGMMRFGEDRPIDGVGRYWLAVHAANCYGIDKVPFNERVKWVMGNALMVQKVATDPMAHEDWHKADKPFQFLAACRSLLFDQDAAKLPVQLDGTCNGLQWYAAITRDPETARLVNLAPGDRPADIYSTVADVARPIILRDAANGTIEAQTIVRLIEAGRTKWRSLVKQPVMTTVYGVTMVGARDQTMSALADAGLDGDPLYKVGFYLSRITINAIGSVCAAARKVMDWLATCARLIASKNRPVTWTTPLGFPVVQPYRKDRTIRIRTVKSSVVMAVAEDNVPVAVKESVSSFPPNFIHSIDASHMLLTAKRCREAGLSFAAVHDSFWTHAQDVPVMARILRETFVEIASMALLDRLWGEWKKLHPDIDFPEPPARGTFDINSVLDSPYLFS